MDLLGEIVNWRELPLPFEDGFARLNVPVTVLPAVRTALDALVVLTVVVRRNTVAVIGPGVPYPNNDVPLVR